jgi:TonB family protein
MILSLLLASTVSQVNAQAPAKSAAKKPAAKSPAKGPAHGPAKGGAQGAQAGSSAALNGYANDLRQKMSKTWVYPQGTDKATAKNHVTLKITVNQDGSVSNLNLESNPKNAEAEQKANDAFNSAQPLSALPSGVSEATITAVFDSEADQWDTKGASIAIKIDPSKSAPPASEAPASEAKSDPPADDKK